MQTFSREPCEHTASREGVRRAHGLASKTSIWREGMWIGTVDADGNGFVLFDPVTLADALGRSPHDGEDLLDLFLTSDLGDRVVACGAVVPTLAIDSGGYTVHVRTYNEPSALSHDVRKNVRNGMFPFSVTSTAYAADLAVLRHWMPGVGWHDVGVAVGLYSAEVIGYQELDSNGFLCDAGYEFCLSMRSVLPSPSGDTGAQMNVMRLPFIGRG